MAQSQDVIYRNTADACRLLKLTIQYTAVVFNLDSGSEANIIT